MEKIEDKLEKNIPEIKYLEERFKFIQNDTLRVNLSISFQYVIFLITLEEEVKLQGPISYSLFKNIILHTASIVEGSLHYLLNTLIKKGAIDVDKALKMEDVYSNKKTLYTTENGIEICGIHVSKKRAKLDSSTSFMEINRVCKRLKILNKELFEEVEELRRKRNRVHLAGLKEVDDYYGKKDIQKASATASRVLTLIEEKLSG